MGSLEGKWRSCARVKWASEQEGVERRERVGVVLTAGQKRQHGGEKQIEIRTDILDKSFVELFAENINIVKEEDKSAEEALNENTVVRMVFQ